MRRFEPSPWSSGAWKKKIEEQIFYPRNEKERGRSRGAAYIRDKTRKARRVRREATTDRGHHCGMRRAARGSWSHYYGKRSAHAVRDINESTATYRKARRVRRDAATDRGHQLWHAKSSKRLLEPLLWQAKSACSVRHQRVDCNTPQSSACAARSYN